MLLLLLLTAEPKLKVNMLFWLLLVTDNLLWIGKGNGKKRKFGHSELTFPLNALSVGTNNEQ